MSQIVFFYILNEFFFGMSNPISNIYSFIGSVISAIYYMHDIFVLVFFDYFYYKSVLHCEAESSKAQSFKNEHNDGLKTDIKDNNNEPMPTVNVTYVSEASPFLGRDRRIFIDLNQNSGNRLKQLLPQKSYPSRLV